MPDTQPRNLVFCCDGTANQYGTVNTSVVHLYRRLASEPATRIARYEQRAARRRGRRPLRGDPGPSALICGKNAPVEQKCAKIDT